MTKIDIISGFLGAGKTTLIKKLLAEAFPGEKLVLIENEFGEIGIDGGFLKEAGISEKAILHQIRFHHAKDLKGAMLPADSPAYITYIADNIASAADRREAETPGKGFSRELAQDSIFNRLNGNEGHSKYAPGLLTEKINFPTEKEIPYDSSFYERCLDAIRDNLRGICLEEPYLNSLLEVLEANCSFVPSSTALGEAADVSLF